MIVSIIRSLGASLKNRKLYPPTHPLVRTPVDKCFSEILPFFAKQPELALAISDDTLVFEGVPIFNLTSSLDFFMERLAAIGIQAIVFEKGLSPDDIDRFIRFLHETKEERLSVSDIQNRIEALGVGHIRVKPPEEEEEDDHTFAREIYNNAVHAVVTVLQDIRLGKIPSGAESERVVKDISGMLQRNRDAIMALTLIKNFDEYTYNHSVNVAVLALSMADALSLSLQEKTEVGVAGLLHDVGKTQLALDLIRKPGSLTTAEFEEIKKHPEEGFLYLGKMSHIRPTSAVMVREHHVRYDRNGYPSLGSDYVLHPNSQIISVADCYDALTTMRAYQMAKQPIEALDIMQKLAGKSLDPNILAVLKSVMGSFPIGTMVRLDSMEVGVVTGAGPAGEGQIRITILIDRQGNRLPHPEEVDLGEIDPKTSRPRWSILGTVNPLLYPDAHRGVSLTANNP
ncbi:MAG: HD-GYP domain-containing protein [Candidatus Deferrimicrobiaceae bacterium]